MVGASTYQPMDNLCHTLVGLALAESGLKRKTALGTATLVIGANLPDVDALSYFRDPVTALGFRRGWTHAVLALALWPFVLSGLILAWDRWVRRRRNPGAEAANDRWLLALSAIAVITHPLLDFLNTYGVRWLIPFSNRWYYGDTLFIVDPWIWLALLAGIVWSRARAAAGVPHPEGPALAGIRLVVAYILLMATSNILARRLVWREIDHAGADARNMMAAPAPASPFYRTVVVELPSEYRIGDFDWRRSPRFRWTVDYIPKRDREPEAQAAAATPTGRTYLRWARFPFYGAGLATHCPDGFICMRDARYFPQAWAEVAVPVSRPLSLPAPTSPPERP
ncbi:MAG: metal-dependent hydrolase [Gemmatimonadetes bacterium]|nr:metal-dependent hydrolase [Gemmatimonadota bacterium]